MKKLGIFLLISSSVSTGAPAFANEAVVCDGHYMAPDRSEKTIHQVIPYAGEMDKEVPLINGSVIGGSLSLFFLPGGQSGGGSKWGKSLRLEFKGSDGRENWITTGEQVLSKRPLDIAYAVPGVGLIVSVICK